MFITCRILRQVRKPNVYVRGFRLPKRIILVRHGESVGNVNEEAYATTPDWAIPLTQNGKNQARRLGSQLEEIIGNGITPFPKNWSHLTL
jgi:hypothetical protein